MMHRVVAYPMPLGYQAPVDIRVLAHIVTHDEEGGFDLLVTQYIQYGGCDFGYYPIIEGEVHNARTVAPPCDTTVHSLHPTRKLIQ
jgi:hypothetical protein